MEKFPKLVFSLESDDAHDVFSEGMKQLAQVQIEFSGIEQGHGAVLLPYPSSFGLLRGQDSFTRNLVL